MNAVLEDPSTLKPNLDALRNQVRLLEPHEAEFAAHLHGFNAAHSHRPLAVIAATSELDVLRTVRFARDHDFKLAVQSTGHGFVRICENQLLLNVSAMNAVKVNPIARTATFQSGTTWAQILEATRPYGLTGLVGDTPSVGATGFTLGGGYGWFGRQFGLACDSLLEARMVTGDGDLRVVSAARGGDLFWALRGGGGGFGVVTEMTLRLYPVPTVLAGNIVVALEHAEVALVAYRDWVMQQPEAMTSRAIFLKGPDIEAMPPFARGKVALMLQFCYTGEETTGRALAQPLLDIPNATLAIVQPTAPADLAALFGTAQPGAALGRAELLDNLPDQLLSQITQLVASPATPPFMLELRHMGGAVKRSERAYAHWNANFLFNIHAMIPVPVLEPLAKQLIDTAAITLKPFALGGIPPNFINADEGETRDKAAFNHDISARLEGIKMRLDPKNTLAYARTPGSR